MAITRIETKHEMVDGKFTKTFEGLVTSYAGCVLEVYNKDYRAMSDVYTYATFALVWDDEANKPVEILVNANFECDMSRGHAQVDATPLHQSKFLLWNRAQEIAAEKQRAARALEYAKRDFANGKTVKVVKGRKIPVGTTGKIFWKGNNGFGLTLGIATSERKGKVSRNGRTYNDAYLDTVFVAADNCEVVL